MESFGINFLIFAPALAAIVICFVPEARVETIKRIALWVGIATAVVALWLFIRLPAAGAMGLIGETNARWISFGDEINGGLDIRYHVGADALSGALIALTGLLVPLSVA